MGAFLDKFEGIILNYSRRIISAGIFLVLIGMAWNFLAGALNAIDSPNVDLEDTYDLPRFEEPVIYEPEESSSSNDNQNYNDEESQERVERDYSDELDEMAETIAPLFVSLNNWNDLESANNDIRAYLAGEVDRLVYFNDQMNVDQRDEWVDGAVDYIDDLTDYMVDKYDVNRRNPSNGDTSILESVDEGYLQRPLDLYREGANKARSNHIDEANEASMIAAQNNITGLGQLMYVLYAIGVVVLLVLILLVFKAENSLRRSADSMEKN